MTQALYLYGVAGAGRLPLSQVYGVEGGVTVLEHGGLGAIVGAPPAGSFQELSREKAVRLVLGHRQVLETAMTGATVLPVKFGTVAPSEAAVRSLMRQQRDMLTGLLAEFSGCMQMEIAVLWQPEAVFADIAAEPAIAEVRREAQNGGNKAAAVKLGQLVKAAFETPALRDTRAARRSAEAGGNGYCLQCSGGRPGGRQSGRADRPNRCRTPASRTRTPRPGIRAAG